MLSPGIVASVDVPAAPVGTPSGDLLAYITPKNFTASIIVTVTGGNYEVDWGDGTYLQYPGGFQAKVIPTGQVTVKSSNSPYKIQLRGGTDINIVKSSSLTDLHSAFYQNADLVSFAIDDASNVTTINGAWTSCTNLASFPLIDTSSVLDCTVAWRLCSSLTSFPALDLSSCTTFDFAWSSSFGLTSFPTIDISSAVSLDAAWFECINLESFAGIVFPASLTSVERAWLSCISIESFPSFGDTSNVLNWDNAFKGVQSCVCLTDLDTTAVGATKVDMFLGSLALINPNIFAQADLQSPTGAIYTNPGTCP